MPHAIAALGTRSVVAHSNKLFLIDQHKTLAEFEVPSGHLDNLTVSKDGTCILAVNHADKSVILFDANLTEKARFAFPKRPSSIAFKSGSEVLVADKFGDVYNLDLKGSVENSKGEFALEPVLGHVSMLLKIALHNDKILTADRDEHIKVSSLANPFNILGFCFGHTHYVSALCIAKGALLSAGGDTFVAKWSLETYEETGRLDLSLVFPDLEEINVLQLETFGDRALCIIQEKPVVLIIEVETMKATQYLLPEVATDISAGGSGLWVATKDSVLLTDLVKTEAFPGAFGDSEVRVLMQHEMRKRAEH